MADEEKDKKKKSEVAGPQRDDGSEALRTQLFRDLYGRLEEQYRIAQARSPFDPADPRAIQTVGTPSYTEITRPLGSPYGGNVRQVGTGSYVPGSIGDSLQKLLQRFATGSRAGLGGFDLPSREELLGPRRADINDIINQASERFLNRFAGLGRSVSGSVPTGALGEFEERRAREVNRAGGEVDTLLAELGFRGQQAQMQNLISLISMISQFFGGGR